MNLNYFFSFLLLFFGICFAETYHPSEGKLEINFEPGNTKTKFPDGISISLPGYRYCGPGTNIEKMDDAGGPVNDLDFVCRQHDVDYLIGTVPREADGKFLLAVQRIRPELAPFFIATMETKSLFEAWFGKPYTSYLYHYPANFKPSLTFFFTQTSALRIPKTISEKKDGNLRWATILGNVWLGVCYKRNDDFKNEVPNCFKISEATISAKNEPTDGGDKSKESGGQQLQSSIQTFASRGQQSATSQSLSTPISSRRISNLSPHSSTALEEYPSPSYSNGCRFIINEVAMQNSENGLSFIEHERICPRGAEQPKSVSLSGFLEIVLEASDTINQVMIANFQNKVLSRITEQNLTPGTRHKQVKRLYFVVGSEGTPNDIQFTETDSTPEFHVGLPFAEERTFCIILLKIHHREKNIALNLDKFEDLNVATPLTDEGMVFIKKYLQDVFIVGAPCSEDRCGFFFDLIKHRESVVGEGNQNLPLPDIPREDGVKPYLSLSRCAINVLPMQMSVFQISQPTPKGQNNCNTPRFTHPFSFRGRALQSTAQKLIVNAKTFLDAHEVDPTLMQGSSVEKTASLLGINKVSVQQTIRNYQSNEIQTPGQKRIRPTPALDQFDQFRIDHLYNVIKSFYQNNLAPTLDMVYNKLMEDVREEETGRAANGETLTQFKCTKWTLRNMIRQLGFRFKRINNRAVILLRMDIVAKRWDYLTVMKQNRESENPKCVIYTDETWIDPYSRTGKGWVINKPKTFEEDSLYSFKDPKVGRGPRIIILHAGGQDGFVPNAMKIYPVSKKKMTEDYHQNVDGTSYMSWWKNLNQNIQENYGACIIVIDNAPYHSTTEAPKSNWKKQELYDWLVDNLPLSRRSELKPIAEMRRPQLWNLVNGLKSRNNYYIIDKEAEKYGNTVVRLPPYNCDLNPIEYVWKDIKHAVRCSNSVGTSGFAQAEAQRIMATYPKEKWQKHIQHVIKLEEKYWAEAGFYERIIDRMDDVPEDSRIIINDEDEIVEEDDEENIIDPFRREVHDDVGMEETSIFSNIDENPSSAPEAVQSSRRRLNLDGC